MATSQSINNTRLTGTQTFNFTSSQPGATEAVITINRTINGGLNSLAASATLQVIVERSLDGETWEHAGGATWQGGAIVVKGITLATEKLSVGLQAVGEQFRFTTIASSPVRIAGTVDYLP
jgi:hypothetical protein